MLRDDIDINLVDNKMKIEIMKNIIRERIRTNRSGSTEVDVKEKMSTNESIVVTCCNTPKANESE